MLGETITARTPVESGMSDNEIVRHVRESESGLTEDTSGSLLRDTQMANLREVQRRIRNSPLRIAQMRASGAADDLRALRDEPGVEAAGLKSEIVECVRRAREDVRKGDERLARTCNA